MKTRPPHERARGEPPVGRLRARAARWQFLDVRGHLVGLLVALVVAVVFLTTGLDGAPRLGEDPARAVVAFLVVWLFVAFATNRALHRREIRRLHGEARRHSRQPHR